MSTLGQAVDLFRCCIFTWKAVTTVLPAFLIAGAVVVFVPSQSVMKYLGAKANRFLSYGVSALSGNVLTVCSCNVVPIFAGILRRGAGVGPAFCFVFAAPAIHLINTVMTYQVIGPKLALLRFLTVPVIAVVVGLSMALIFRHEERAEPETEKKATLALVAADPGAGRKAGYFVGALIAILLVGASIDPEKLGLVPKGMAGWVMVPFILVALAATVPFATRLFSKEEAKEWGRQSYLLLRMILPIFIPSVIVIALIVQHIPLTWVAPTAADPNAITFGQPQGNHIIPVFLATVFGTIMYFPMLTEVAFTKGLLLEHIAIGPALAILLGGPGLSLPGLILVSRIAGWKKTVVYWALMVVFITITAFLVGNYMGKYTCPCQMGGKI